jgi:hypothetical protein
MSLLLALLTLSMAAAAPPPASPPDDPASDAPSPTFADSVQAYYSAQEPDGLRMLVDRADSRLEALMARYRLYPLTEDASVIDGVPSGLEDGSARELAILSGIWAYRAGEASFINAARYGRRSVNLLEEARAADPDEPYVLLVGGQSLLFRPSIAGRDVEAAVDHFRRLIDRVEQHPHVGIARTEARSWLWLALREAGRAADAQALHDDLTAGDLRSLYRQFLDDPPEV